MEDVVVYSGSSVIHIKQRVIEQVVQPVIACIGLIGKQALLQCVFGKIGLMSVHD